MPVACSCCWENIRITRYEKHWKALSTYERHHDVSRLQPLHVFFTKFYKDIQAAREIKSWWTKTSTVECTVCSLRSTQGSSFCWNRVACAMPDLCMWFRLLWYFFTCSKYVFYISFTYVHYVSLESLCHYVALLLAPLLARVEDVEVCKVPALQDCQHNGVQAVPMSCTGYRTSASLCTPRIYNFILLYIYIYIYAID